jgi:hypothetical protein
MTAPVQEINCCSLQIKRFESEPILLLYSATVTRIFIYAARLQHTIASIVNQGETVCGLAEYAAGLSRRQHATMPFFIS